MNPAASAPVALYTRRWCGYCFAARRLCKKLGVDFVEISLDRRPGLRQEISDKAGGWRTVPMIFVGERFIGGYSELADLHAGGRFLPMVASMRPTRRSSGETAAGSDGSNDDADTPHQAPTRAAPGS